MTIEFISFIKIISQIIIFFSFIISTNETYNNKRINLPKKIYILCFSIIMSIVINFLSAELSFLIYGILIIPLFIIYKYILDVKNNTNIMSLLLFYIMISFCEMLAYFLIRESFNAYIEDFHTNFNISLYFIVLKLFIFITLLILLNKYIKKNNKKLHEVIDSFSNKELLFLISLCCSVIIPELLKFNTDKSDYNFNFLSLNIFQLAIIFTLIFSYFKYIHFYNKSQSELIESKTYNKTLVELVENLRILKHDYNNILQSINGYIVTKQYNELEEHMKSLTSEASNISNLECINPEIINQPAIYGIVGAKYFVANSKNIQFKLDVLTDISTIDFDFTDLSRILGILLDNAIEASEKTETPKIHLTFKYDKAKQANIIIIKNSVIPNLNLDVSKIFNKGVSSKKVKSGIGLWEVKKIISSKYNSQIYASLKDNEFCQTIIIEKI